MVKPPKKLLTRFGRSFLGGNMPFGLDALMAQFKQHHATPERKKRRHLVKQMGRRQAIKYIKDTRSLAKVEARIEEIARKNIELEAING